MTGQLRSASWTRFQVILILSAFFVSGCSAIKYVPDHEYFYKGTDVVFDTSNLPVKEQQTLAKMLLQLDPVKPNATLFGSRPAVWFYHIAGNPGKNAVIRQFMKTTLGTAPAYLDTVAAATLCRSMISKLNNEGYFRSGVTYAISRNEKKKEGSILYYVSLKPAYHLKQIQYPTAEDSVTSVLTEEVRRSSLLRTGQRYSTERLQAEISRIGKTFKDHGFYFFGTRYLVYEADSTIGNHEVDLSLTLAEGFPPTSLHKYRLGEITAYLRDGMTSDTTGELTVIRTGLFTYRHGRDVENFIKPGALAAAMTIRSNSLYSQSENENTVRRLMALGVFRSVNTVYTPSVQDTALLHVKVMLMSGVKKSLRSELNVVSKSNNTVGPVVTATFTNRNSFHGAEKLDISLSGAYETQVSNKSSGTNALEVKLESTLTISRFLLPFEIGRRSGKYLPKTVARAGVNLQNRIDYYNVNTFYASWGYEWRASETVAHTFHPVDLSYVKTANVSDEFRETLQLNPSLAISLQNQFILCSRYSYTFNNLPPGGILSKYEEGSYKPHTFRFTGALDISGNFLDAVMKRTRKGEERPYLLLGSPFSQYAKADADFRYHWQLNEHQKIAMRVMAGAGYAYGNAETLPYVKQYSIGGASSIRAFPARTLGPGSYNRSEDPAYNEDSISFTDQYGEIKMEGNAEYRFDIYKAIKGALFLDAGNIWTFREDSARVGSQFLADQFYKQLAVGAGIGLRFDFGFFLLRFDTAIPLRRPDSGWVVNDIDLRSAAWRKENIIFSIAIGYPF